MTTVDRTSWKDSQPTVRFLKGHPMQAEPFRLDLDGLSPEVRTFLAECVGAPTEIAKLAEAEANVREGAAIACPLTDESDVWLAELQLRRAKEFRTVVARLEISD